MFHLMIFCHTVTCTVFDCLSVPLREEQNGSLHTLHCDWLSFFHRGGHLISTRSIKVGPGCGLTTHFSAVAYLSILLQPSLPPKKSRNVFLYLSLKIDFIFPEFLYFYSLLRALISLAGDIFQKYGKREKWVGTRKGKIVTKSSQNKDWCFFQNLLLKSVFCISVCLQSSRVIRNIFEGFK